MKYIKVLSLVLFFIELNLLFTLLFLTINYILFEGKELSGTLVTIATIAFVLLSLFFSSVITRRIHLYLKADKNKTVAFVIISILVMGVIYMAIKMYSYLLPIE